MKLITAIIRPDQLTAVKAALFRAGVTTISTSEVNSEAGEDAEAGTGVGGPAPLSGAELKVEMACTAAFAAPAVRAILSATRTDLVAQGKLMIRGTEQVISLFTGRAVLRR